MRPEIPNPKPATLRRRERKARLLAGRVSEPRHGDAYWARNWGCECSTCAPAISKLNREQYLARKAARAATITEGEHNV